MAAHRILKYSRYKAEWYASRPIEWKLKIKSHRYEKLYGITYEEVLVLWEKQNRKCAICNKEIKSGLENKGDYYIITIDHNHDTGVVRGLLCHRCNTGLGGFMDSVENLKRAIIYLTKNNK